MSLRYGGGHVARPWDVAALFRFLSGASGKGRRGGEKEG